MVVGDDEVGLVAVIDRLMPDLEQRVQQINHQLPDYAQIQQLLFVNQPSAWQAWLTANGRPKRALIENAQHTFVECVMRPTSIGNTCIPFRQEAVAVLATFHGKSFGPL